MMEIGCGVKLAMRMPAYDAGSGLSQTAASWGPALSCLKVMKIRVELVSVPIIKTWKPTQYKKAEALITFITGSMLFDGGCNRKQLGTNNGRSAGYNYENEIAEVSVERNWLAQNLKESQADTDKRLEEVEWHSKVLEGFDDAKRDDLNSVDAMIDAARAPPKSVLPKMLREAETLFDSWEDERLTLQRTRRAVVLEREAFAKELEGLAEETADVQGLLTFHSRVQEWLRCDDEESEETGSSVPRDSP